MKDQKQQNWFARHKVLTVILVLFGLITIGGIAGGSSKDSNIDKASNTSPGTGSKTSLSGTTEDMEPTGPKAEYKEPAKPKEKLTLSNATFNDEGYGYYGVDGEATNNDSIEHSASIKATFYDANGKILGTAIGAVNDVAPGDTKTYSLSTSDKVSGYANMKVQVDTLL